MKINEDLSRLIASYAGRLADRVNTAAALAEEIEHTKQQERFALFPDSSSFPWYRNTKVDYESLTRARETFRADREELELLLNKAEIFIDECLIKSESQGIKALQMDKEQEERRKAGR